MEVAGDMGPSLLRPSFAVARVTLLGTRGHCREHLLNRDYHSESTDGKIEAQKD